MNDLELIAAFAVPVLVALLFRVPRRTLLLAKETEILSRLRPGTTAHRHLRRHIDDLVEREVASNKDWLLYSNIAQGVFTMGYGALLLLIGFGEGGWWHIASAMGALLIVAPMAALGIWLKRRLTSSRTGFASFRSEKPQGD